MSDWTMSEEREFMENLLNQRFNFFLVVYGAVVVGASEADTTFASTTILSVGAMLLMLLLPTIGRAQVKLDCIIEEIRAKSAARLTGDDHPVVVIDERAKWSKTFPKSRRRLVGFYIPGFCCATIYVAAIYMACHLSNW
jgi:hypothetical protein